MPQIDVSFEIDANGIVNVSAKDKMTGLEQAMQITPSSGLAPEEIERLIIEAESSVERDRGESELIIQKNRLENMIKNARKAMAEYGRLRPRGTAADQLAVLNNAEESLSHLTTSRDQARHDKVEETADRITAAMLTAA